MEEDNDLPSLVNILLRGGDLSLQHVALLHLKSTLLNPLMLEPPLRNKLIIFLKSIIEDGRDTDLATELLNRLKKIQISVQSVSFDKLTFIVDIFWPTFILKFLVEEKAGVAAQEQHLVYGGKPLTDETTLLGSSIEQGSTIHLIHNRAESTDSEPKWVAFRRQYREIMQRVPPLQQLAGYGYKVNGLLELRSIRGGDRYQWTDDSSYQSVGNALGVFVEEFLIDEFGFIRLLFPLNADPDEKTASILMTRGALGGGKVVVMVPTHTVTTCGLFGRKIVVNDSIHAGSVVDYVGEWRLLGLEVVLLNPNVSVGDNRCPADHIVYMWDKVISRAGQVIWFTHQVGSTCLAHLIRMRPKVMEQSVGFIFLDPYLDDVGEIPNEHHRSISEKGCGFVLSSEPAGRAKEDWRTKIGCSGISLGVTKEILAPAAAKDFIINWMKKSRFLHLNVNEEELRIELHRWKEKQKGWIRKYQ